MKYQEYFKSILEMAQPRESDRVRIYYHGTDEIDAVIGILKDGVIKPSENKSRRTGVPVIGRMYLTPSIKYALIYAMGGIKMGEAPWKGDEDPKRRYGAVFVVSGLELSDIQPDEDAVGEMLHKIPAKETISLQGMEEFAAFLE